jgi:hypothetical protein
MLYSKPPDWVQLPAEKEVLGWEGISGPPSHLSLRVFFSDGTFSDFSKPTDNEVLFIKPTGEWFTQDDLDCGP